MVEHHQVNISRFHNMQLIKLLHLAKFLLRPLKDLIMDRIINMRYAHLIK